MTSALNTPRWPNAAFDFACAASFSLLLAASAGPRVWITTPASAAIVVCLDTSGSMNTRDIRPSRASAAVLAIRSFVNVAPTGLRIGLVSFAGDAQRLLAPTGDRRAIIEALERIPRPNGQTAIGDGLLASAAMLPDAGPRAIVLVTDGANNHGVDPRAAVRKLAATHIRLNAIVVGGAPFSERLRKYTMETSGIFSRPGSAADLMAQIARLAKARFDARASRDCTVPCAVVALFLGAAAWLGAAGAARL